MCNFGNSTSSSHKMFTWCTHLFHSVQEIGKTLICKMQMQQCTTFWDKDFVDCQFVIHMTALYQMQRLLNVMRCEDDCVWCYGNNRGRSGCGVCSLLPGNIENNHEESGYAAWLTRLEPASSQTQLSDITTSAHMLYDILTVLMFITVHTLWHKLNMHTYSYNYWHNKSIYRRRRRGKFMFSHHEIKNPIQFPNLQFDTTM